MPRRIRGSLAVLSPLLLKGRAEEEKRNEFGSPKQHLLRTTQKWAAHKSVCERGILKCWEVSTVDVSVPEQRGTLPKP